MERKKKRRKRRILNKKPKPIREDWRIIRKTIKEHKAWRLRRDQWIPYIDTETITETTWDPLFSTSKEIEIRNKFWEAIRNRREFIGITQKQLAKKTGLDRSTIIKIENWKIYPSLKIIWQLAVVLQTRVSDLMKFKWQEKNPKEPNINYSNILINFWNLVQSYRKNRKRSQNDLVNRHPLCKIMDVPYISKVENGKMNIWLENIARLARAFDLDISVLMDF